MILGIRLHENSRMVVIKITISLQCSATCRVVAGCIELRTLISGVRLHDGLEMVMNQSTISSQCKILC